MAELDPGILSAVANSNFKTLAEGPIIEMQRNTKAVNGLLETALANNIKNLQSMDIGDAAAINSVIRTEMSPQLATLAASVASLRSFLAGVVVSPGAGTT